MQPSRSADGISPNDRATDFSTPYFQLTLPGIQGRLARNDFAAGETSFRRFVESMTFVRGGMQEVQKRGGGSNTGFRGSMSTRLEERHTHQVHDALCVLVFADSLSESCPADFGRIRNRKVRRAPH